MSTFAASGAARFLRSLVLITVSIEEKDVKKVYNEITQE